MVRLVSLCVAAAALLTTACGAMQPGGGGAGSTPSDSGSPRSGGILNARVQTDYYDFDVTYTGKGTNARIQGLSYNALLGFKSGPGIKYYEYVLQPRMAEKWEISPDGTSFTFHLRHGIKFADLPPVNGREFTSADVKWTYEYGSRTGPFAPLLKDKKLPPGQFDWMFEGLQGIDTPDAYTATVRFAEPFTPFLNYSGHHLNPILPHEIFDQDGDFRSHMVGTGPFQLDMDASQKGARWVWKKNATYWDTRHPYLDEIRWIVLPDDSTAAAAFKVGQVDLIGDYTAQPAQDIERNNPKATKFDLSGATPVHMYMNTKFPPFQDLRVRKAVSLAINRDELVQVQTGGTGGWALAGTYPSMFTQEEIKALIPYDPAQAKQLLTEAGYGNGLDVQFEYPTDNGQVYVVDFQLLQAQLKKVGINFIAKPISYAEYSATKKNHTATVTTTSKDWQADIDGYLYGSFQSASKDNYDGINDPKLDAMLAAQRREPDVTKRTELIKAAVKYINAEMYWGRALYGKTTFMFANPALKGYGPNFQTQYDLTNAWLDR